MTAKETAYIAIQKLVDKFDKQIDNYKSANYNETLTRRDFIDPFFEALGWDINNHQNLWEGYRQVIHEDKIKIGTSTKAPDYSFRLPGGQRLFFVEAKKPNVDIYKGYEPARQVRLYGWNAKLAISIVTDFEEFAVYDCSKKPGKNDKPSKGRIEYFTYKDYLNRFDFIWDTFSHTEVMKGGLVRYQQADKKGTATVDKDFLASLDEWRKQLALSIAKYNDVNEDELNFAVQQTIDRLIFLRFAEDRQLEPEFQLKSCLNDADHYKELLRQFRVADDKYNSGLFHFRKEKENSSPHDTLTTGITVDNKTIKSIINGLYDNEYLFDIIPVEILGSAYEQFLGKRIVLKSSTRAEIEDKPEVRKAGGVYYTPQYIVDYIVEHTVGKLCEGKTSAQVAKLKIVDPACGSGSFLLGAYDYLLKWHLKYYEENPTAISKKTPQVTPDGLLTTAEKKRILVNNIYGVDIDDNAVEVTKLSLLLKCMEGETKASVGTAMTMFHERVLPSLENNIKAGNSLVDYDYYSGEMDFGEERKVRPFSWQQAFPDVFKNGGFDAVIGNPPYGASINKNTDSYFRNTYEVANYQLDTYVLFIEKAKLIAKKNAIVGFIIPSAWVASQYDIKMRKFLTNKVRVDDIVISHKQTFKDATVETSIIIYCDASPGKSFNVQRWDKENVCYQVLLDDIKNSQDYIFPVYADDVSSTVSKKIKKVETRLGDFAEVVWGVKVYENGKGIPPQNPSDSKNKIFHSEYKTKTTHRPLLGGKEVSRYHINWNNGYIDYGKWLAAPRHPNWFDGPRILVREITTKGRIQACFVSTDYVYSNSVDGIRLISKEFETKYLLGLLNSKLISFYHLNTSANAFKGAFPKVLLKDLRNLPIPIPSKQLHETIVKHVDTMLQLNEELQTTTVPARRSAVEARIAHTDKEIDKLVYQLYGLTDEEIKIVEGV